MVISLPADARCGECVGRARPAQNLSLSGFCAAPARCCVPRDNQHRPGRAAEYTFADRALLEPLPPAPPIGSKDDEIGLPRIGMQDNHARRVAVLFNGSNRNALSLCTFPKAGQQLEPFALVHGKRTAAGYGVKDVEPGVAHASDADRTIERTPTRPSQVDCAQDLPNPCHVDTSILPLMVSLSIPRSLSPIGQRCAPASGLSSERSVECSRRPEGGT
jgi:hypothetical protein